MKKKNLNIKKVQDLKEGDPVILIEHYLMSNYFSIYELKVISNKYNEKGDHKIEVDAKDESVLENQYTHETLKDEIIIPLNSKSYIAQYFQERDVPVEKIYCFSRKEANNIIAHIFERQKSNYRENIERHQNEIKRLKYYHKIDCENIKKCHKLINNMFGYKD